MKRIRQIGLAAVTATALLVAASPADAAAGGRSTWGEAKFVNYTGGAWWGTVDDIKEDGYCVSLWTINSRGAKLNRIARSCGYQKSGGAAARTEDSVGVRMFRGDGRYKTIVWP